MGRPGPVERLAQSAAGAVIPLRTLLAVLVVSIAYYLGAEVGFALTYPSALTSIFWLPNATMFAVFLLVEPRRWWMYVLAAAPAHLAVQVKNGVPPLTMVLLFFTNIGDGALGAFLVRRFSRGKTRFESLRSVAVFLVVAVACPFAVSLLDAAVKVMTGSASDFWLMWHTRVRSNVLTNVVWVPAVVCVVARGASWVRASSPRRYLEAGLLASTLLLVGSLVFGAPQVRSGAGIALLYAPLPLFLWAAAHFSVGGVAASLVGFSFVVIWHSVRGLGPFTTYPPGSSILALQVFLTLVSAPLLLLAALLQERKRTEGALRDREAQYRSIFESTSDGVLITNLANGVVAANPAFCQLTGYDLRRLRAIHPRDIFHLDDLQPLESYLARASAGDQVEARAMCVREDRRLARVLVQGRRFSYGGLPHVLSVVRELGDRERAFQELEERVAERTRVLSTLLEISNTVASTLELRPLLRVVLEQLQIIVEYTGATIFIQKQDDLTILDHRGPLTESQVGEVRVSAARAVAAVLHRDSPLIVDDLWSDSDTAKAFRAATPPAVTALFGYARSLLMVPLKARDRTIGFLRIDSDEPNRYSLQDAQLAWALATQAAVAIENARLYDQARELAALEERQRLARELHDSVTQTLYATAMVGELLPRTWERDPGEGRRSLASLQEMTRTALAEMRTLLLELRPAALLQSSLGDLLRQLAEALRSRSEAPIDVEVEGSADLPPDVQVTLYRVAQEVLGNVVRHAAASTVHLALRCSQGLAELSIRDDGRGFDPASITPDRLGITVMRERLAAIGAALSIDSQAERGTLVTVQWSHTEGTT
jgi:two-component system nitrate/nitrite sensor histidine kinase NarX